MQEATPFMISEMVEKKSSIDDYFFSEECKESDDENGEFNADNADEPVSNMESKKKENKKIYSTIMQRGPGKSIMQSMKKEIKNKRVHRLIMQHDPGKTYTWRSSAVIYFQGEEIKLDKKNFDLETLSETNRSKWLDDFNKTGQCKVYHPIIYKPDNSRGLLFNSGWIKLQSDNIFNFKDSDDNRVATMTIPLDETDKSPFFISRTINNLDMFFKNFFSNSSMHVHHPSNTNNKVEMSCIIPIKKTDESSQNNLIETMIWENDIHGKKIIFENPKDISKVIKSGTSVQIIYKLGCLWKELTKGESTSYGLKFNIRYLVYRNDQ